MRKFQQQAKPQILADILQYVLKKQNILLSSEHKNLQAIWSKAVGAKIAVHTNPVHVKKGSLSVKVSTPIWMQQLHFMKAEIIEKFNRQAGKDLINNIVFSIGKISPLPLKYRDSASFIPESFPLQDRDKKKIEQCIASVADQDLKEILKRVMIKDIIRKRINNTRKVP